MTIEELRAFLSAVEKHPELREELRRHVLTQELLAMPAELYRQTARLDRVEEELAELRDAVRALVTSSQHHEEELRALRAIAERHEQRLSDIDARLDRLVAITERHDQRLSDIDERLARLVTITERHEEELRALRELAQKHDDDLRSLRELAQKHDDDLRQLRSTVASLTTTVGAMVEADAVDALLTVLEQKGFTAEELPASIAVNGELDIVAPVVAPDGQRYWVVVEVKVQLHPRDIRSWLRKLHSQSFRERLAAAGIEPPFLAYVYGQRVYRPALERARELGIGILSRRGEYVAPASLVV